MNLLLYVIVEGIFIATSYALLNSPILPQAFHSHLALRWKCVVRTNVSSRRYDTFVLLVQHEHKHIHGVYKYGCTEDFSFS